MASLVRDLPSFFVQHINTRLFYNLGAVLHHKYSTSLLQSSWTASWALIAFRMSKTRLFAVICFILFVLNNRREDQAKVRRAILSRRIDPADIPASAKLPIANHFDNVPAPILGQKKRKASAQEAAAASSSQTAVPHKPQPIASSQLLRCLSQPAARQEMEDEDEEANAYEEEPRDELYCILDSKIVGVQYYKGCVYFFLPSLAH